MSSSSIEKFENELAAMATKLDQLKNDHQLIGPTNEFDQSKKCIGVAIGKLIAEMKRTTTALRKARLVECVSPKTTTLTLETDVPSQIAEQISAKLDKVKEGFHTDLHIDADIDMDAAIGAVGIQLFNVRSVSILNFIVHRWMKQMFKHLTPKELQVVQLAGIKSPTEMLTWLNMPISKTSPKINMTLFKLVMSVHISNNKLQTAVVVLAAVGHDDNTFLKFPFTKYLVRRGSSMVFLMNEIKVGKNNVTNAISTAIKAKALELKFVGANYGMIKFFPEMPEEVVISSERGVKLSKANGGAGSCYAVSIGNDEANNTIYIFSSKTSVWSVIVPRISAVQALLAVGCEQYKLAAAKRKVDGENFFMTTYCLLTVVRFIRNASELDRQQFVDNLIGTVLIVEILERMHFEISRSWSPGMMIIDISPTDEQYISQPNIKLFKRLGFTTPTDLTHENLTSEQRVLKFREGSVLWVDGRPVKKIKEISYTYFKFVMKYVASVVAQWQKQINPLNTKQREVLELVFPLVDNGNTNHRKFSLMGFKIFSRSPRVLKKLTVVEIAVVEQALDGFILPVFHTMLKVSGCADQYGFGRSMYIIDQFLRPIAVSVAANWPFDSSPKRYMEISDRIAQLQVLGVVGEV